MGRIAWPGHVEMRRFPCRRWVNVWFDTSGFPTGLVVDSICYRLQPAQNVRLVECGSFLELVRVWHGGDYDAGSQREERSTNVAEWRRLLRREIRAGNRRRIRRIAGGLFKQLRTWYWRGEPREANRLAAAEMAEEFGLELVPLQGRRALEAAGAEQEPTLSEPPEMAG